MLLCVTATGGSKSISCSRSCGYPNINLRILRLILGRGPGRRGGGGRESAEWVIG
jgi:hypothetical protein